MDAANSDIKLVKKRELAALIGVGHRTIDNWVANQTIPYLAVSPRLHLFDPIAVRKALETKFTVQAKTPVE